MSVREYIGARYVPIFGREGESSIAWDNTAPYEPLTVVTHSGDSYVSRQYVPAGVAISNTDYWAHTSNYNAQIEQYRSEVQAVAADLTAEETARASADTALGTRITNEASARASADNALGTRIDAIYTEPEHWVLIGDSYSDPNTAALAGVTMWYTMVLGATVPRRNVVLHNYAKAGAGFIHSTGTPFPTQASQAAADTSFDHNKVTRVIVYGGINDISTSENITDCYNAALTTFQTLSEAFKNAEHTFYNQFWPHVMNRSVRDYLNRWANAASYRGFCVNNDLVFAFMNVNAANYFQNDLVHPNNSGMGLIAAIIGGVSSDYCRLLGPLGAVTTPYFENLALNSPYSNGTAISETAAGYDGFLFRDDVANWFIQDKRAEITGITANSQPIILKWDLNNAVYQYWSSSAMRVGSSMVGASEQGVTTRCYMVGRILYLIIEPQSGTWTTDTLTINYGAAGSFILD